MAFELLEGRVLGIAGVFFSVVKQAPVRSGRHVGRMRVPVVNEQKERLFTILFQPGDGPAVDVAAVAIDAERSARRRVNVVFIASPEPVVPGRKIVDCAGRIPCFLKQGRKPGDRAFQRDSAAVCHDPVRDRILAAAQRSKRGMRGNGRRDVLFAQNRLPGQRVQIRRRIAVIAVTAQVVRTQGVHDNQNRVQRGFHVLSHFRCRATCLAHDPIVYHDE